MQQRLKSPYLVITLVFTALYIIMFRLIPFMNDDIWYRSYLYDFLQNPSWANFRDGLLSNYVFRSTYDNIRIPALIMPVMVGFSNWLPTIVNGGCIGLTIWLGGRLTGTWNKSPIGFALWLVGILYLPPWSGYMFGAAYATFYIPAMTLALACIVIFFRKSTPLWMLFILSFIASMWHEIVLASLVGGVCGLMLFDRDYRNRRSLAVAAGSMLALALYLSAKATYARLDDQFVLVEFVRITSGIFYGIWFYVFAAVLGILLINHKTRERIWNPTVIFISAAAVTGWCVHRVFSSNEHSVWMMLVFVALGFAIIARTFIRMTKTVKYISAVVIILCIVQQVVCLPWFFRLHHEQEYAVALAKSHPEKSGLFAPMTLPSEQPIYILGRPNFNSFTQFGFPALQVVPERLSDFSPVKAKPIGINGCEAYLYKGLIVLPFRETGHTTHLCDIGYGDRPMRRTACVVSYFTTDAGTFVLVRPRLPLNTPESDNPTQFCLLDEVFDCSLDYLYDVKYL